MIDRFFDFLEDHGKSVIFGIVTLTVVLIVIAVRYEMKYPCLKYGPQQFAYMQKIGDIFVPVYTTPCIQRRGIENGVPHE